MNTNRLFSKIFSTLMVYSLVSCAPVTHRKHTATTRAASSTATLNLEIPIEMLGVKLSSNTTATSFEMTQTSLNTTDYDGEVSYYFEAVATNSGAASATLSLIDSASNPISTIDIPAGTAAATRIRSSQFNPATGSMIYRVRTPATTVAGDVLVYAARLIVKQVGATKTRIYYPLADADAATTSTGDLYLDTLPPGAVYGQGTANLYSIWKKDVSALATIAADQPWTFETVLAVAGAPRVAFASLYNNTTTTQVTASEVSTTSLVPVLLSASFASSATAFTDNQEFEVKLKTDAGLCINAACVRLYKAGIWVKLTDLTKAQVFYRVGSYKVAAGYTQLQRALITTSNFTNPNVYFESTAVDGVAGDSVLTLRDDGSNDSGTPGSGLTATITPNSTTRIRTRTSSFTITDGARYYGKMNCAGTCRAASYFIVVNSSQ